VDRVSVWISVGLDWVTHCRLACPSYDQFVFLMSWRQPWLNDQRNGLWFR